MTDDDDTEYRLTEDGIVTALRAYEMYKSGLDHAEIEAILLPDLEYTDDPDDVPGKSIQLIFAMANYVGVIDKYEEMMEIENTFNKIVDES